MSEDQTAFGAAWFLGPVAACRVLRAQASRALDLAEVGPVDAAAAVAGAHVWSVVVGETSLTAAHRHLAGDIRVAARILARAAGAASTADQPVDPSDWVPSTPAGLGPAEAATARALAWLREHLEGDDLAAAAGAAAVDLAAGAGHPASPGLAYAALLLDAETA